MANGELFACGSATMKGHPMKYIDKLRTLFLSRRFQIAAIGVAVVVFQDLLRMSEDQATVVAGLMMSWIVGDSINKTE